jgi:hypothetical protein
MLLFLKKLNVVSYMLLLLDVVFQERCCRFQGDAVSVVLFSKNLDVVFNLLLLLLFSKNLDVVFNLLLLLLFFKNLDVIFNMLLLLCCFSRT